MENLLFLHQIVKHMEIILDELTPVEFFNHGGIVKITIKDDNLVKECNLKKKYTFFDYKSYIRFFRNLYMTYTHNHSDDNSYECYKYINGCVELNPSIGNSEYVVDLNYDRVRSYEVARFYYSYDRNEPEVEQRDPYGIKNVCFSLINEDDDRWEKYTKQRLERGFDNSELWNLDGTIAKFIYPRLKAFVENSNGIYPDGVEEEEWKSILDKMVKGFELISSDRIKTDDEEKLESEALELLCKYFFCLWI